jgi:hypothetical protein
MGAGGARAPLPEVRAHPAQHLRVGADAPGGRRDALAHRRGQHRGTTRGRRGRERRFLAWSSTPCSCRALRSNPKRVGGSKSLDAVTDWDGEKLVAAKPSACQSMSRGGGSGILAQGAQSSCGVSGGVGQCRVRCGPLRERTVDGERSKEVRYFISSLPGDDAQKFASAV